MMKRTSQLFFVVCLLLGWSASAPAENETQGRERLKQRFPHFMSYVDTLKFESEFPVDADLRKWIHADQAFHPQATHWDNYFKNAIADRMTNIRAFALLGLEANRRKTAIWTYGKEYQDAIARNKVTMGLGLPAQKIYAAIWDFTPNHPDPDHLMTITMLYEEPYIHEFPSDVVSADVKVGQGDPVELVVGGQKRTFYPSSVELFSNHESFGFRNIRGIAGQKHGVVGFLQKLLFFVPDSIHGMELNEKSGTMVTKAFVDTKIEKYEENVHYQMAYKEAPPTVPSTTETADSTSPETKPAPL